MKTTPRLSFEFFPPKTEAGKEKLLAVRDELKTLNPEFYSVTYGAGGSTRDNTRSLVTESIAEGFSVAPHLSFGGDNQETIHQLLDDYRAAGVDRIVALRGDMPSGVGDSHQLVHANQLVEVIRARHGDHFHLEVAAYPEIHPEASNYDTDVAYLKKKFDAGANSAITQYFFNADSYFYFIEACDKQDIKAPIYPGIMPILNVKNLIRFSDSCGADIPRWLRQKLEGYGADEASVRAFGIEVVTRLCETLLDNGAPGLHFYTMNQTQPTSDIVTQLNRW